MQLDATTLPAAPLLKPWYKFVQKDAKAVFHYADTAIIFEGTAVSHLFPTLLPLLDGTRSVAEIVAAVGDEYCDAAANALKLLHERGLLMASAEHAHVAEHERNTVAFMQATIPTANTPQEDVERLRTVKIAMVGSGAVRKYIREGLAGSGITHFTEVDYATGAAQGCEHDLLIVTPAVEEMPLLQDWNTASLATGTSWLLIAPFEGCFSAIGPLFIPGQTACYECFRLRRKTNLDYPEEMDLLANVHAPFSPQLHAFDAAVGGLAATLILRWLLRDDHFISGRFFSVRVTDGISVDSHHVLRVPRCGACSVVANVNAPLPWYEEA